MTDESKVKNGKSKDDRQTSESKASSGLKDILEAHRGEHHVVVLQNFPDPDAIASAYAHKLISREFDIEVDILHSGEISHQQNRAMVKLLEIELLPYDDSLDLSKYDGAVFVDNQGTTAENIVAALEKANVPLLITVDHHEPQERIKTEYRDIRPKVGATATIYAEYLEKGGLVEMDKSKRDHPLVATALFHGLLTDTGGFIYATSADFQAAAFLSEFRDSELLGQIMSQRRSRQTMEIIGRALEERVIVENYSIVGIGYLRAEDRDTIPQVADFLLTEEYIHTAIVYGIVIENGRETLIGSLRTSKATIDPDDFIKDVFGKDASGHYFGGGKMTAGGFEIPVGFLSGEDGGDEYLELKWRVYNKQIKAKIYKKIGVEQESDNG